MFGIPFQLALVFCGDVLLATRKELWESMLYLNDQDGEQLSKVLEAYKGDLKVLKSITNVYHPAKEKVTGKSKSSTQKRDALCDSDNVCNFLEKFQNFRRRTCIFSRVEF